MFKSIIDRVMPNEERTGDALLSQRLGVLAREISVRSRLSQAVLRNSSAAIGGARDASGAVANARTPHAINTMPAHWLAVGTSRSNAKLAKSESTGIDGTT